MASYLNNCSVHKYLLYYDEFHSIYLSASPLAGLTADVFCRGSIIIPSLDLKSYGTLENKWSFFNELK